MMQEAAPDRSLQRIIRIGIGLGIAGTIAMGAARGLLDAAGFLTGASLSVFSFHTLRRLGEGLQPGSPGFRGSAAFFGFRYVIIGAVAYGIVKLLGISVMPVLTGLFVSAAAVLVEILYELVSSK
jgi:hypothetical protein